MTENNGGGCFWFAWMPLRILFDILLLLAEAMLDGIALFWNIFDILLMPLDIELPTAIDIGADLMAMLCEGLELDALTVTRRGREALEYVLTCRLAVLGGLGECEGLRELRPDRSRATLASLALDFIWLPTFLIFINGMVDGNGRLFRCA